MPRLPKDSENLVGTHVERCIARAWVLFERYENKVDFEKMSEEQINQLYAPYMHTRELAINIARSVGWKIKEAESLP